MEDFHLKSSTLLLPPPSNEELDNSRLVRLLGANVLSLHEETTGFKLSETLYSLLSVLFSTRTNDLDEQHIVRRRAGEKGRRRADIETKGNV